MLEKAYKTLKYNGYDLLVCLGDITGFATEYYAHTPDANACINLLRENADIILAGNHDLFSSKRLPSYHLEKNIPQNWYELTLQERYALTKNSLWLYEEEVFPTLTPENVEFLSQLDEWRTVDTGTGQILFSHFFQPDLAGIGRWFPYRVGELRPHFRFMEEQNSTLAFVGHCHPEGVTMVSKLFWSVPAFESIRLTNKPRIVLCPPIVNNKSSGSCIIYDSVKNEITPYILKYS